MKHFLIATDLSARSDRAVLRGFALAKEHGVPATLVSVVDSAMPEDLSAKLQKDVMERLQEFLKLHGDPETTEIIVPVGDVVVEIDRLAREKNSDLVVLGLHRKRGFMDSLRQTTMERIVTISSSSVLLVLNQAVHSYKSVLIPVSYSLACSKAVIAAKRVAPSAEISAFHAVHVPFAGITGGDESEMERAVLREVQAQSDAWQSTYGVELETPELVVGGPAAVLYQKVNADKPELVAIGAHTRSGPALHKLGSFAADLVRDPPTDLLVTSA